MTGDCLGRWSITGMRSTRVWLQVLGMPGTTQVSHGTDSNTVHLCGCLQSDYHFEYTECDSSGSRWRVAVPNAAVDCAGLPDPVRGKECSTSLLSDACFWLHCHVLL